MGQNFLSDPQLFLSLREEHELQLFEIRELEKI
jgi:hypothetical protein